MGNEPAGGTTTVAIVGAGWLGSEIAIRAAAGGHRVVAVSRKGGWGNASPAPEAVERVTLDVLESRDEDLAGLLKRVGRVVFCWAPGADQCRRRLYVEGAARITRVCGASKLERVVYTSSTSALADHDGWVDEGSTRWPESDRGRIQRDAEDCIANGLSRAGVPWSILRLAGLYGPGRELASLYRLGDAARVRPGDGLERTNLVHRDDAARAVLAALVLPPSESGLVHVCDDDHRTRREVAVDVARLAGWPEPLWAESDVGKKPRGKMVCNEKMKSVLGLGLEHPGHGAPDERSPR